MHDIEPRRSITARNLLVFIKHSENLQAKSLSHALLSELYHVVNESGSTLLHVAANNCNF